MSVLRFAMAEENGANKQKKVFDLEWVTSFIRDLPSQERAKQILQEKYYKNNANSSSFFSVQKNLRIPDPIFSDRKSIIQRFCFFPDRTWRVTWS